MMASHEGDEDAEIEAEIQRELDALNIEDLEDTLSSDEEGDEGETEELTNEVPECINQFILRVQSRTDDIQQEISECDALLSKVVEVTDEEKEEYFYQSKELKEFAFRIGEDPEELRDRVIQELAAEDEEDTKPLALEGPEVKVLALEGPLFEGRDDTEDGPVLALEGPSSGKPESEESNQLVLADPGTLETYMEPIQRFEETAKRSVRDFEERFNSQLQEYKEDYEENQRSRVRREKLAEEDRARRRRENNEEQQRLAERRMIEQSKMQEKLEEDIEISRKYLDKYENDIKTLDAKTKEEKLAFLEERLEYQKLLAEKMSQSALKIQSVYRSYRARKPFLKKLRRIKEDVKKKMADKRQMEVAAQRKLEEQRKKKERDEKRRREEDERRKLEEEVKEKAEEERKKQEREEREKRERKRREAEVKETKRIEEERIEQEKRMMEEKANEILAKIMKEKESEEVGQAGEGEGQAGQGEGQAGQGEGQLTNRDVGLEVGQNPGQETGLEVGLEAGREVRLVAGAAKIQPAVKVNMIASEFMNIHNDNGNSQQTSELTAMRNEGTRMKSVVNSTVADESDMSRDGTLNAVNIHRTNDNSVGKQRELVKEDQLASPSVKSSIIVAKRDKATSEGNQEIKDSSHNREGESSPEGKIPKTNHDTQKLIEAPNEYSPTMEYISDGDQPMKTVDRSNDDMNYSLASNPETALAGKEQHEYSSVNENIKKVQFEEGTNLPINNSKFTKELTSTENKLSERNGSDLDRGLSVDKQGGQRAGDDLSGQGNWLGEDGRKEGVPSEISQSEMEREKGDEGKDGASIDKGKRGVLNSEIGEEEVTSPKKAVVAEKGNLPEELEKARRKWMETSTSFSKQLIKAKDRLRNLEKEKRKYLRRPSALKKMAAISEEKLLEASLVALTLAEVTTVKLVNLPGCTLKTLNECPRLNTIRCRSSAIQGLEGFHNSPDVTFIDFKGNQLASVNCRDLQNLTYLDLSSNKLSSVHGLEGCSSLKWLDLSNNKISRLDGVEYLLLLSHLDVSNNQLINCQSLSSLVHLVSLNLSNNHLSTVPELDSCPLLQSLKFTNNSISEFPSLSNHVMVIELLLDNNSLISMETMKLSWLPRLEYLSLAQNSLSIIPVLNFAFNLKKLDLRNNYITDLQSLSAGLSKLPYLKSLYIDGNPVTEELNYKNEISKLSPSLVSLDDDECESTASSHPPNQFEEMCHSQIVASRALKERHGTVVRSIQPSKNQLHNEAVTWSAYLEYSLKMAVDHRYMHEYGDLSPVTCSMSDLCRMIPDLTDSSEGHIRFEENKTKSENIPSSDNDLSEKRFFDNKEGSIYESDQTQKRDKQFGARKIVRSQFESIEESSKVATKKFEKDKTDKVDTNLFDRKDKEDQTETSAAIKIQSVWRGFKVRRDIEVHTRQYLAVLMIQALWRGYAVRKRYRKARAALQNQKCQEEEDELYLNEDVDLEFLEFSEESLEKGWLPPETPQVPKMHPPLPPKYPIRETSPYHRPLSSVTLTSSPSPEKFAPHPPRQAWKGGNSPLSPKRTYSGTPHDMGVLSGKPPLPPVTPSTQRGESSIGTTARTVRSKKEEKLSEEWGFKDNTTAELMLKRAKKMNRTNKKKMLDPIQKFQMIKKMQDSQSEKRVIQAQAKRGVQRKDYFKARQEAEEQKVKQVHDRTFEWVHSHEPHQASTGINSPLTLTGNHSSSEPNLPRMSPDVLQGRVQLTASPSLDLQSVEGSSVHGFSSRGRSNSLSSPDVERHQLPPLKTNSAPTSHSRQRQTSNVINRGSSHAWGKTSQIINKRC